MDQITSQVSKALENFPFVQFAYLFGSCLSGYSHYRSDIDIAVYLEPFSGNLEPYLSIHHHLAKKLDKEIDLVILNKAKNFFLLDSIIRQGVVVLDRVPDKREIFEVETIHNIIDYKAFKQINAVI